VATEPPSTPILDDFQRADENPLSQGGNWFSPGASLSLASHQARSSSEEFTFVTSLYGNPLVDSEVYVTIAEWTSQLTELLLRTDSAASNGYSAQISGGTATILSRSAGTPTTLAEAELTVKDGDAVGLKAEGSVLSLWHKPSEGEWTLVESVEDSTHESGYIGLSTNSPLTRYEDFGGGGEAVPPPPPLPKATAGLGTFRDAIATELTDPIAHPDGFVICQWWQTDRMEAAREVGAKVLIYLNLTRAAEPDSEGRYSTGLTLAEAEALGAATEQVDSDAGTICLPGTAGYAEAWAEAAISRAQEVGADGVMCDDMNAPNDGYSGVSDEEWLDQMQACNEVVGPALSAAGLLGIPNMSGALGQRNLEYDGWVEEQFQYYDGGLDEFFVTFPKGEAQPAYMYEEAMAVMHRQQVAGKLYLASTNTDDDDLRRFALGCCLLHTAGGVYAHGLPAGPDYGKETWDAILEEALALGRPTGEARLTDSGWVRDFRGGSVVVDLTTSTALFKVTPPPRVVVHREHPPSTLAVRILAEDDTPLGRWAEDEPNVENVIGNLTKTGDMPGGHGESGCVLARDPKRSYPDLALFSKYLIEAPGGEVLWQGTLRQQPQSDGDHISIEPKAVGDKQFLEDDEAVVGPGFISSDLSRWTGPSVTRRLILQGLSRPSQQDPAAIWGTGNSALHMEVQGTWAEPIIPVCEAWFDAGSGVGLEAVQGDWANGDANTSFFLGVSFCNDEGAQAALESSGDYYTATSGHISQTAGAGQRYAVIDWQFNATNAGIDGAQFGVDLQDLKVLGANGLTLQGTWPEVGFLAKQMIPCIVEGSGLTTKDELLEDDGFVIPHAWFSDPGTRMSKLTEVTKYGLLDGFVFNDRIYQYRFPGTYGRCWRLDSGSAPKSSGPDASRVWSEFRFFWQDVDGTPRFADLSPLVDPTNAAVASGRPRRKLLQLNGVSTEKLARQTAERFREEAMLVDQSGEATLSGYVQDQASMCWFPAAYVQPGDRVFEPGTGLERRITSAPYGHAGKAANVTLGAPPEGLGALEARFGARLIELGFGA
jgi:hypothetical protein